MEYYNLFSSTLNSSGFTDDFSVDTDLDWSTASTSSTENSSFTILNELGTGTFGEVFLCLDQETGDQVAVKRIRREKGDSKTFQTEFENFNFIDHPRVIKMHSYFEDCSYYNFVLEYAPNGTLRWNIKFHKYEGELYPESDAIEYLVDMLCGIEYLHSIGIIHRDLTPDNVVFDESFRLKICDFGGAKFMNKDKEMYPSKTGARRYAAPEIIKKKSYDEKVDVWSMGIIFYEILNLVHPFLEKRCLGCELPYLDNYSIGANLIWRNMLMDSPQERATISIIKEHPMVHEKYLKQVQS